jgi:Protein of unknown function (DUF3105)
LTRFASPIDENGIMASGNIRYWLAGGALLSAAIWGVAVLLTYRQDDQRTAKLEATRGTTLISTAKIEGNPKPAIGLEVHYTGLVRTHTLGQVKYNTVPPVGGPHSTTWQNCGAYNTSIPVMTAVHSLEHGAVWVTYKTGIEAGSLEKLRTLARKPYVLVSMYPTQPAPIILTAWGVQLQLERFDLPRVEQFVSRYANRKDGPEPGAPCVGGTGIPLGAT